MKIKSIYPNTQYQLDRISFRDIIRQNKKTKRLNKFKLRSENMFENIKSNYPFIKKEDLKSIQEVLFSRIITPNRYVYHLSKPNNRISIARFGLQIVNSRTKGVFANNQELYHYKTFFPFCLHEGDPLDLDIWQIDTKKTRAKWHVDPFLCEDDRYICTSDDVPPTALRLYKALVTRAVTSNHCWLDLGSLEIENFRFIEHKPTAIRMDRYHFNCSKLKLKTAS